jgi:hypothetical protein
LSRSTPATVQAASTPGPTRATSAAAAG